MRGEGQIQGFQADEVVLAYERAVANDATCAANIRYAHPDLSARFDAVDTRLAVAR